LSEEEKPAFMLQPNPPDRNFYTSNSTFEKPSTGTFYDNFVPRWRGEWMEHRMSVKLAENLAVEAELPLLVELV